jgi:hypothetical protein
MAKGLSDFTQAGFGHRNAVADARAFGVGAKAFARLAEAWGLTNADAAALLGVSARTWSRMKAGDSPRPDQDLLMRISGVVGLYKGLHLYFSDALADRWPKLANTGAPFMNRTPVDYMKAGGLPAILETRGYVDALRGGV